MNVTHEKNLILCSVVARANWKLEAGETLSAQDVRKLVQETSGPLMHKYEDDLVERATALIWEEK